jgi:hypothetical protein
VKGGPRKQKSATRSGSRPQRKVNGTSRGCRVQLYARIVSVVNTQDAKWRDRRGTAVQSTCREFPCFLSSRTSNFDLLKPRLNSSSTQPPPSCQLPRTRHNGRRMFFFPPDRSAICMLQIERFLTDFDRTHSSPTLSTSMSPHPRPDGRNCSSGL